MRRPGSGRKKGSLNKKTLDLMQKCDEAGVDAFAILLESCKSENEETRFAAAKEVCQYLYSKKRAVEVSTSDEGFKVVIEDYLTKEKK